MRDGTKVAQLDTSAPTRRSFFHDVFSVATTRVAVLVMTAAGGVLIARLLGVEGKGLVTAVLVAPTIVVSFCDLGLTHAAAFHIGRKTFPLDRIVGALALIAGGAALLGSLACLIYFRATWIPDYSIALVALATASIPLTIIRNYSTGVFLGVGQIKNFNRANWAVPFTRVVFIVLFAWVLAFGALGVVAANLASAAVMAAYSLFMVAKIAPLRFKLDVEVANKLVRLGVVFAAALFIMTLLYRINIVMLQQLGSLSQIGIYSVGANLAEYIWQIPTAMMAVVFSRGANAEDPDSYSRKVLVLFRITLVVAICGALGVAVAGPIAIPLLYGEDFAGSAHVMWAMLPGVTAFTAYKVLNMDLAGRGKPHVAIAMSVPALLLNVALCFWLIPIWGAVGAGLASSFTYCLAALIYLLLYCRVVRIPLGEALRFSLRDLQFAAQHIPLLKRFRKAR